ncbi:hypothetical protein BDU57DRAFT_443550 [Ampelomyces quisqualis]|uniref:Fatty acid hydroxylase domain-containing protein n=1 Tax=Ampelomyces quisqualis TaxID=50730 RepID=A0A6A5QYI0_AMPQU|nr:hypothetical protein BDU57DRAFT_443550 [Ampelomyces quisqualis]
MYLTSVLAPFTVPLASLLAIPMLSSWSTSLNLVFLSLAWTTIAATYSPLQLEAFAPLFIRLTLYIFPSLVFLLFDIGIPSLSAEVKSQGQLGIATKQKGGKKKMWTVAGWSLANVVLAIAIQAAIEFVVTDVLRMKSLLQIKGSNVTIPYSFVANYDHPACHILHRFLPLYLPAIALRMHILTYLFLSVLFSLEESFVYSGYSILPSTIMLRGMARRTDAHMMSKGDGNFGPLGVLDWIHDTTLGKDVINDLKAEMEKHQVDEKAGNTIDGAGKAARGLAGKLKGNAGGRDRRKK